MATNEQISAQLAEVSNRIATLSVHVESLLKHWELHDKQIHGSNGHRGMKADIQTLQDLHKHCPARNSWLFCFTGRMAVLTVILAAIGQSVAIVTLLLRL